MRAQVTEYIPEAKYPNGETTPVTPRSNFPVIIIDGKKNEVIVGTNYGRLALPLDKVKLFSDSEISFEDDTHLWDS